jgi:adenylate kinase
MNPEHQRMRLQEKANAVLLVGPTGSGKTPLGDLLQERGIGARRCVHFDFGAELRRLASFAKPPEPYIQEEQQFIRQVLKGGVLLEDKDFALAKKILLDFNERMVLSRRDLLVLNGFPRHCGQARSMEELVQVKCVIVLECEARDILQRIASNTGKDRKGREDDSLEMIQKKMLLFKERTTPLVSHYSGKGAHIVTLQVKGDSRAEEVYNYLATVPMLQTGAQ